ncbi:protocadherin beta-16-like protein [Labeo rohita]|uniref:Protocadherin beta-16-like protein n=1 Tax=Labeo rohita TaxID=84645 RepID=A0A498MXX4_LABRO|nr:protocadherin beta-16-like protein [Labeo rohita]
MVPKAAQARSLVSKVIAVDADSGQNAWLSYHIIKATDPGLFTIGDHSGEIRTQRDISESDSMKQNLIVSVRDNGQPSLSATCALYLLLSDNLAEVPELKDMSRDESSSKLTFYLIIALVSVSTFFLTFIIIILAVKFCRRRKPRLLFDGAVAIPSAYLPPNYAEVEGAGTLRSTYNYDAYLTTGSRTSDFKFVRSYNEGTLTADLTLKKPQSAVDDLEGLDAEMSDSFQCSVFQRFCVTAEMFGLLFFVLMAHTAYGDVSYSFPEEMKRGSVIGNIAKDIGLDVNRLSSRNARIDAEEGNSLMTEMVPKAAQARSLVSKVIAVDADSGQNAWLSYHIIKATDPGLFTIGVHSGEIRTQRDISESDSMKQNLIVSVRDNGQPSLSATCMLYLLISDNLAEVPELKDMSRDESSSKLTFYLIIALVSVSTFFLTFIIIILAVKFCRRRKPRLLFDGAVAIPSAYLPPNYAEVEGAGTLRSTYNYDAYLTTGSRTSDFKFVRSYNEGTLTADLTLKKTQSAVDDLEGLETEMNSSFQVGLTTSLF